MDEELDIDSLIKKKKKVKEEKEEKALFFQRFVAFLIDMLLVSVVASFIVTPFIDTKKTAELNNEINAFTQEFQEYYTSGEFAKDEDKVDEYVSRYTSLYYESARQNGTASLISIFLGVLYFVVYQTLRKGQTLGKRLMKIRVVSEEGELSYNQMIFRSFLANFIIFDLMGFVLMLFGSKHVYFYSVAIITMIQFIMIVISAIMIMNKNDGRALHDKIVHTKVIREK